MPKGDRLKLKADPEDGTTPIANLLLEAVAMAKLSGLQTRAILYLWRRTYGWVEDGKRLKERKIPLPEWVHGLDSTKPRVSVTLTELEAKGIIQRRLADSWGGYYYRINTNVKSWNSNCLNIAKLSEMIITNTLPVTENVTVAQSDNSSPIEKQLPEAEQLPKTLVTVTENATEQLPKTQLPTLYKEILNKDIKKEGVILEKSPFGEKLRELFARLDKERGYVLSVKRRAEAASMMRMLKKNYTTDQIIKTWRDLKAESFWADKELFMMTIESQIGAKVNAKDTAGANQGRYNQKSGTSNTRRIPKPNEYTTPEEWRKQRQTFEG